MNEWSICARLTRTFVYTEGYSAACIPYYVRTYLRAKKNFMQTMRFDYIENILEL